MKESMAPVNSRCYELPLIVNPLSSVLSTPRVFI